jgi:hypothetical protein
MKRVVAFVPDLMDRSRFGQASGVQFVDRPDQLVSAAREADLVIVDLGRPGVLDVLPDLAVPTVGFGSHVDRELLEAARAAGCDQVLARSAFFSRLQQILH